MNIVVNDQNQVVAPDTTIAQLLEQLGLGDTRVAVERNAQIVPRSRHADTPLKDGDRLEIVKAVGGG